MSLGSPGAFSPRESIPDMPDPEQERFNWAPFPWILRTDSSGGAEVLGSQLPRSRVGVALERRLRADADPRLHSSTHSDIPTACSTIC